MCHLHSEAFHISVLIMRHRIPYRNPLHILILTEMNPYRDKEKDCDNNNIHNPYKNHPTMSNFKTWST